MKNPHENPPPKLYDAVEDAVDLSRKDTNSTWDDLSNCEAPTEKEIAGKSTKVLSLPTTPKRLTAKPSIRSDVFTLDEGEVILQYPERLSAEGYEDSKAWLDLTAKKAKRAVGNIQDPTALAKS